MTLSPKQARRLALHRQGLLQHDAFGRGLNGVRKAIQQLHYVQIDTISVVDRAHHHVLKSRVSNYSQAMLDKLIADRSVFEYWFHAAAFMPIEDYRFYRPIMEGFGRTRAIDNKLKKKVLERISAEGPLQSRDFEDPRPKSAKGWWEWKPAKKVLEHLFLSGELMVTERKGFQKVYDLTERVLPADIDTSTPTAEERGHFYVQRMLTALGPARLFDIGYARAIPSRWSMFKILPPIETAIGELMEDGKVTSFSIDGDNHYAMLDHIESMPGRVGKKQLKILSPFDNIVINRSRLSQLFNFDYQIECYLPAAKRQYGYFTLPILLGDEMIGRVDCKNHRDKKLLAINNLWLEQTTKVNDELVNHLATGLKNYATSLDCNQIVLSEADNKSLYRVLKTRLS